MRNNKLTIHIQKPIAEVFEFTTNPENTPRWIDSITKEESSGTEIEVGTKYTNWSEDGDENTYFVSEYKKDEVFQLDFSGGGYKVRYTYRLISGTETELEYLEWNESGELEDPFKQETMEKLKRIMEVGK